MKKLNGRQMGRLIADYLDLYFFGTDRDSNVPDQLREFTIDLTCQDHTDQGPYITTHYSEQELINSFYCDQLIDCSGVFYTGEYTRVWADDEHLVRLDSILSDLYGSEYNQFKIVRQSDY